MAILGLKALSDLPTSELGPPLRLEAQEACNPDSEKWHRDAYSPRGETSETQVRLYTRGKPSALAGSS